DTASCGRSGQGRRGRLPALPRGTPGKRGVVNELASRAAASLDGEKPSPAINAFQDDIGKEARTSTETPGKSIVLFIDDTTAPRIMVKSPDRPGLLSAISGTLALRGINVRSADVSSVGDTAIDSFVVELRIGDWPDWNVVASDIDAVLDGNLP
ncbi:Amino acid-binding ACT domain protein, partial [mine drainage metagenome]